MNWRQVRILFWTATITASAATLWLGLAKILTEPFLTYSLTVEGVLVAGMSLEEILKKRESVDVDIHASIEGNKFGIRVDTLNKTLKEARVFLNGTQYPWTMPDGSQSHKRDIFVGETPPAVFFPFSAEHNSLSDKEHQNQPDGTIEIWLDVKDKPKLKTDPLPEGALAVLFVITETSSKKEFARLVIVASRRIRETQGQFPLEYPLGKVNKSANMSIRIIAEGIEEVRDYVLGLNLLGFGFDSQKMGIALDLKEL